MEKSRSMSELIEHLNRAIEGKKNIKIIYYGGSQPGTIREIMPIKLEDSRLWAKCHHSNAVKLFKVDKLQLVNKELDSISRLWNPKVNNYPYYSSLEDLFEKKKDVLLFLGWHIENDKDFISLHRKFKNGRLIKSPEVGIYYEDIRYDEFYDPERDEFISTGIKRQKPYVVSAKKENTRSYVLRFKLF